MTALEVKKSDAIAAVDGNTEDLIRHGFVYDEKTFSLSVEAQGNWQGIWQAFQMNIMAKIAQNQKALYDAAVLVPGYDALEDPDVDDLVAASAALAWPIEISTKDDQAYSLAFENVNGFIISGLSWVNACIASGRPLKVAIAAAADIGAVNAVVDTRDVATIQAILNPP